MFVLGSHVVSELRQGSPNHSIAVREWVATQPNGPLFISAITQLKLELGIQSRERRTPPQRSALGAWLTGMRAVFAGLILPFTESTASVCAALLHAPSAVPTRRHGCGHWHPAPI